MNKRGRPAEFRNAAEKQKAYRERKKQQEAELEALRKYEYEHSLEGLADKVDLLAKSFRDVQAEFPRLTADDVPEWSKAVNRALDAWWDAHGAWYRAWIVAGALDDKKPKSSRW
jgi:seryl-tRNA synthetase